VWEAKYQTMMSNAANRPEDTECGFYFPYLMEGPWVFQVVITPEETTMIWAGREIRHILTDGRKHLASDDIWPTPWGDSIGHWEAGTLAVDTIGLAQPRGPSMFLPMDTLHVTERIRRVSQERLEDEMTFISPEALTTPWTVTIPYKRITTLDRMIHGDCRENDRNPIVDGKTTVTVP
jgi:hypothetical protein